MLNKKLQVWLPLIFAVVMVAGMFFGYQMNGGSSKSFFSKPQQNTLDEVIYRLKNNYVDSINLDSLEDVAIEQMMNELDPHSVYFPRLNYRPPTKTWPAILKV